jgi:aminomethyltransferase
MGALKDFVSINPVTEKPAVIDFPTLPDNPYKIDIEETKKIISRYLPELIIFGKSMVLYREPVTEIKAFIKEIDLDCIVMYDMAHVLGLIGPYFQQPFEEGADIVTGSTHKTFFGTQRGVIGCDWIEPELKYDLWEQIESRAFPGSVSNHHLGTLLGLLAAAFEMNHFKDPYQKKVISNAKVFAKALADSGLSVAGNPDDEYTQTHQVIVEVGFAQGPEIAERLEKNNIITNYQATSEEEGFTASGAIRMGVAEMTRFGMEEGDFKILADYIAEVIRKNNNVKDEVEKFRSRFLEMRFCFDHSLIKTMTDKLYNTF